MDRKDQTPADYPELDLEQLLNPARAFREPRDVVCHPHLTLSEKRAVLASWASDASAIAAFPGLRQGPEGSPPVSVDEILAALNELDRKAVVEFDGHRPGSAARHRGHPGARQ
jgi:hypothetical protein